MGKIIDLTGKKFGRLTVLQLVPKEIRHDTTRQSFWLCQCDCGNIISIASWRLGSNKCNSCGCYRNEQVKKAKFKKRIRNECECWELNNLQNGNK